MAWKTWFNPCSRQLKFSQDFISVYVCLRYVNTSAVFWEEGRIARWVRLLTVMWENQVRFQHLVASCVFGTHVELYIFWHLPKKDSVFCPQYLDMFWFWSLLAVAMQLRFCHTSFCSFWFMLVFSHTHTFIFICLEAEMALLSARFFNDNSTNVAPLMLKTCVLYWCSQPLTHTRSIYTHRDAGCGWGQQRGAGDHVAEGPAVHREAQDMSEETLSGMSTRQWGGGQAGERGDPRALCDLRPQKNTQWLVSISLKRNRVTTRVLNKSCAQTPVCHCLCTFFSLSPHCCF